MTKLFEASDFFFPGLDDGMVYAVPPDPVLVRRQPARVRQIPASENEVINRKVRRRIDPRWKSPTSPPVFETLSVPVRAENVSVKRRKVLVGGKLVLSAAAGDRIWKAVLNKLPADAEAELNDAFLDRQRSATKPMGCRERRGDDSPFVVDMRNGYNFYHFLTETLPQLSVIAQTRSKAPIFVHMPVLDQMKGFVPGFVRAIFPQLFSRIAFTDNPARHDVARLVLNHRHYLYQSSDPAIAAALAELPANDPWRAVRSDRASRKFLLKSTFDTGMRLLRADALGRLSELPPQDHPKRLWIGRDPDHPDFKSRPNTGEAELLQELRRRDFHVAYMERLTPLEQIALINGADMILGPHGAGFAHMIFARRSALALEIGSPQTQLHRWGDFLGNAHVSACAYSTVFADVEGHPDVETVPSIETGHHGVHIGDAAAQRILDHVDEFAKRFAGPNTTDAFA